MSRTEGGPWAAPGTREVPQRHLGTPNPWHTWRYSPGQMGTPWEQQDPRTGPQGGQEEPPTPGAGGGTPRMWGPPGTRQDPAPPGREGTRGTGTLPISRAEGAPGRDPGQAETPGANGDTSGVLGDLQPLRLGHLRVAWGNQGTSSPRAGGASWGRKGTPNHGGYRDLSPFQR